INNKHSKNKKEKYEVIKKNTIKKNTEQKPEYKLREKIKTEPVTSDIKNYKKFKKTNTVLLQLESILLKSKGIPDVGVTIESMFLAELKNLLLTAGHDLDKMELPLKIELANGSEHFYGIGGKEHILTKDDLFLSDNIGILSSILNGPDNRTAITKDTKNIMYFVYGPDKISEKQIQDHLNDIKHYISSAFPDLKVNSIDIF
ncbi:phenylalanine--tRNA ligase beta subunit-related protein, partial [Clostridioides difficile]|uniref:phenylalanine--tRNA ligase beta subunit-related protein n=1 Tax=Clostridioides difficile TaxID=1496 RepID=UPI0029C38998